MKMKKKSPQSLMRLLTLIFKGKGLKDGFQPDGSQPGRVLGKVEDPLTRSLFYERCAAIDKFHAYEHREKRDEARQQTLFSRLTALTFLLTEALAAKFPFVNNPEVTVIFSKDWGVIVDSDLFGGVPFEDASSKSRQVFRRLVSIFTKPMKGSADQSFEEVRQGEMVIGKVTDSRIKAIYRLKGELYNERQGMTPEISGIRARLEWMNTQTLGDLTKRGMQIQVLSTQIDNVNDLLFALIREALPSKAIPQGMALGIRKGWKIVAVPPTRYGPGILEMFMKLYGLPEGLLNPR
jgi:hypothetical protein